MWLCLGVLEAMGEFCEGVCSLVILDEFGLVVLIVGVPVHEVLELLVVDVAFEVQLVLGDPDIVVLDAVPELEVDVENAVCAAEYFFSL